MGYKVSLAIAVEKPRSGGTSEKRMPAERSLRLRHPTIHGRIAVAQLLSEEC